MKANELRLGNYLLSSESKVVTVRGLKNNSIYIDDGSAGLVENFEPIPITEDRLVEMGFDVCGVEEVNEYEKHHRYVLFNVIDGTSSFYVVNVISTYGGNEYTEWIIKIDHDMVYVKELKYIHQLQNIVHALTGMELEFKK